MDEKELEKFMNYIQQTWEDFNTLSDDSGSGAIGRIINQPNFYLISLMYQLRNYSKRLHELTIMLLALTGILIVLTFVLIVKT